MTVRTVTVRTVTVQSAGCVREGEDMAGYKLLVKGARQVVQVSGAREPVKRGAGMNDLHVLEGGEEGVSVLVDR